MTKEQSVSLMLTGAGCGVKIVGTAPLLNFRRLAKPARYCPRFEKHSIVKWPEQTSNLGLKVCGIL